jgi:hypothetical protein
VSLGSPSHKQFEIDIRTNDARDRIAVRLLAGGVEVAHTDVPVRLTRVDEDVTLCVTADDTSAAIPGDCTCIVPQRQLPHSWRGYDAATTWRSIESAQAPLPADRLNDLRKSDAVHALESTDTSAVALPAPPPADGPFDSSPSRTLAGYVGVLILGGALVRRLARRPWPFYATLVCLIGGGTAAALAVGRFGPGSSIVVRHATVVQQFAGARYATVLMRGTIEYPSGGEFEITPVTTDAGFDALTGEDADSRIDENGYSLMTGSFGLGARQSFVAQSVIDSRPVEMASSPTNIHILNTSASDLTDCTFLSGFSKRAIGRLAPDASVDVPSTGEDEGLLACQLPAVPLTLSEPSHRVEAIGPSTLLVRIPAGGPGHD